MPGKAKVGKQKTRSAAKKRIKITGSGKLCTDKIGHKHLLLQKSKKSKVAYGKAQILPKAEVKKLLKML